MQCRRGRSFCARGRLWTSWLNKQVTVTADSTTCWLIRGTVRTEQDPSPDSSLEWGNENPVESQSQAPGPAQSRPRTGQQPVKTGPTEGSAGDAASEDRRGQACRQTRIGQTIPRPVERSVANKKFGGLKAAQPLRNRFIRAP